MMLNHNRIQDGGQATNTMGVSFSDGILFHLFYPLLERGENLSCQPVQLYEGANVLIRDGLLVDGITHIHSRRPRLGVSDRPHITLLTTLL